VLAEVLEDEEANGLFQIAALARLLPVPLLIPVGLAVAAVLGLAHLRPSSRR